MATDILRDVTNDDDWADLASEWLIRPDTVYLNHGSFGPPPLVVRHRCQQWTDELNRQPMDFYVRKQEPVLLEARQKLGEFIGTEVGNLVFVENATYGMNVVADSFPLSEGDEILLNDHEYGAVHRIWERVAERTGARVVTATLPMPVESDQQIVDSILNHVTDRTRLAVFSHITSATALILPVRKLCDALKDRGVAICVDGPHAPAHVPFNLNDLHCDFYTASCHKWLSAPLGSGFLYVHPSWHHAIQPVLKSWGRLLPAVPKQWDEEFTWTGTRNPAAYLTVPTAIEFLEKIGIDLFRKRCYWLAEQAENRLSEVLGTHPIASRHDGFYGTMAHLPLPPGDWSNLQNELWQEHGIEVPIVHFNDRWYVRVSCHLYNNTTQLDTLTKAIWRKVLGK